MTDSPNIMSIRELIDTAFGDVNINVVNHKLIQTILIILARQLRLLERRVKVEIGYSVLEPSGSSLSVTEVKLHANVPRKGKAKPGTVAASTTKGPKTSQGGQQTESHGQPPGTVTGQSVSDKTTPGKLSAEKSSSAITSAGTKYTTEPSRSYKAATDKYSSDEAKSMDTKLSTDQSYSDKSTIEMKSPTDKTTKEKSTSDKTTAEISSTDKSATQKSSHDMASSDKTSTDQTLPDRTSTDKTSADKSPSEDKTAQDKTSSKQSAETPSSDKDKKRRKDQSLSQNYETILERIEEQRELELRVIHQRADSREEPGKTPTPMASLDSMEKQYEKLLIVERVPSGEAAETRSSGGRGRTPRLSVVTQEEFADLASVVRQLQAKFAVVGPAAFPENAQLMNELRKGASLTDAMAALQLSARVEAAEKALEKMMSLVTDLANNTPGIDAEVLMTQKAAKQQAQATGTMDDQNTEVIFGAGRPGGVQSQLTADKKKVVVTKDDGVPTKEIEPSPPKGGVAAPSTKDLTAKSRKSLTQKPTSSKESITAPILLPSEQEIKIKKADPKDNITYEELDNILQEIYDRLIKVVNASSNRSNTNANHALMIATKLEVKLDEALDVGDRMFDLEKLVSEYADQINTLDTGLSSQMTNYQEQLTQMQHDLETGLETMAEALANTGGDTAAVAELNNHFTCLQNDIDVAAVRQKELKDVQSALSYDLQALWKQIEILRETKSDRDEVADALRDKAGLAALNGLVSRQEFDAVRGDFEKRIGSAYDKFNNQEIVWQKAIDDLLRELSEKADLIQVVSLQDSINQYLEKLRAQIQAMAEVVGEPRAATVTKKLHRDSNCLSCATPAHMELKATQGPPLLPGLPPTRPPAVGAEAESKPQEDGDHRVCYPGMPVPHAVDPRAHVCHRYCGGSHTVINNTVSRVPMGMIINPALREVSTAMGTDGKLYMVDDKVKPCLPCKLKTTTTPEPSEPEQAPVPEDNGSDMTPPDFRASIHVATAETLEDVTPPPPIDED